MSAIYCKKCGIRGDSKCPHHRSIFADAMPPEQDLLDRVVSVKTTPRKNDDGSIRVYSGGEYEGKPIVDIEVVFNLYKHTQEEAMIDTLRMLQYIFAAEINIEVAACIHDWELMPGVKASIGCCVGPNAVVPPDPFEEWKKQNAR